MFRWSLIDKWKFILVLTFFPCLAYTPNCCNYLDSLPILRPECQHYTFKQWGLCICLLSQAFHGSLVPVFLLIMVVEVSMIWLKFPSNPIVSPKEPVRCAYITRIPILSNFNLCILFSWSKNDCFPDHSLASVPHCIYASLTLFSSCLVTDSSPPQSEVQGQQTHYAILGSNTK